MAYGGFGGGNMQQLMKQAQAMQRKLQEAQQELADSEVTGSAAGGMVEVTLTGDKTPVSVSIKPEAVDPDDVEMLEDMVLAALNDAMKQADDLSKLKNPKYSVSFRAKAKDLVETKRHYICYFTSFRYSGCKLPKIGQG